MIIIIMLIILITYYVSKSKIKKNYDFELDVKTFIENAKKKIGIIALSLILIFGSLLVSNYIQTAIVIYTGLLLRLFGYILLVRGLYVKELPENVVKTIKKNKKTKKDQKNSINIEVTSDSKKIETKKIDENTICANCQQDKKDVQGRRIFFFKKNLCDACYEERLKSNIKYSGILVAIYIIPLVIGLMVDLSSGALEYDSHETSWFAAALVILALLTTTNILGKSLMYDYFVANMGFLPMYATSNKEYNAGIQSSLLGMIVVFAFRLIIGLVLLPIYVGYNLLILVNSAALYKNIDNSVRIVLLVVIVILAISAVGFIISGL